MIVDGTKNGLVRRNSRVVLRAHARLEERGTEISRLDIEYLDTEGCHLSGKRFSQCTDSMLASSVHAKTRESAEKY